MAEKSSQKVAEKSSHSGFARVPREVVCDSSLSHSAARVYAFLALGVAYGSVAGVGQRVIARRTGMDRSTVGSAITELAKRGHLTVVGSGRQRRMYVLNSTVFGQEQGRETVVVSSPTGRRYASVNVEEVA